ncbi:hypothetical protein BWR18_06015 [Tateyamaria omphalii]|uniref:Uncharacterized protein n=1 Tax=Tateyamaria omphalii TaxID=299262 RepID=A0A1P8N070_9RHOB|nr:hypothetical protein BWR18_06015 [Tateyamaria omphalii]
MPTLPSAEVASVTRSVSPSTSVSLARTLMVTPVLNGVVPASSVASGASLTGVTVTATSPTSVPPFPSEIV